jgi:molybdopterin-guanine dinucleotide biosynthesis protein A
MTRLPPLNGLLLAGGKSSRMGRDKASLVVNANGRTQAENGLALLGPACARIFLSLRDGQAVPAGCEPAKVLRDSAAFGGPLAGILTAFDHAPQTAWLVLACDLPFVSEDVIAGLLAERGRGGGTAPFIAYASSTDGLPEPLCAIYEPSARAILAEHAARGHFCPRHIMKDEKTPLLELPASARGALENVNTPQELDQAGARLRGKAGA